MLDQNLQQEETNSAARARVTAREVAHATASIEARKAAEAHMQSNTIPLGEAIHQLDLPATPEELLNEIRELRQRHASETRVTPRGGQSLGALLGLSAAITCYFALMLSFQAARQKVETSMALSPAPLPAKLTIQSVDSVPTGQPMYCDFETLRDLGRGKESSKVQIVTSSQAPENFWTVRNKEGKLYVEAWASLENLLRAENGHSADIYATNSRSGDPNDTRMMRMLPAERFRDAESIHTTLGGLTDEVSLHPINSP